MAPKTQLMDVMGLGLPLLLGSNDFGFFAAQTEMVHQFCRVRLLLQ
jgi:hypothetical protein